MATFDALFTAGALGTKTATIYPAGGAGTDVVVHYRKRRAMLSDGESRIYQTMEYIKGKTSDLSSMSRGDRVDIDGAEYEATIDPEDNGSGISEIYLELVQ